MLFKKWEVNLAQNLADLEMAIFKDPWTKNAIIDSIKSPLFHGEVLLDEKGDIIAYYGFYSIIPETHIANLAVREDKRGLGLGNVILERLLSQAIMLGNSEFTLEVRPSNEKAIALYKKYGFKVEGRRRNYYGDGEDALIMWKRLA
ncbi:MAG: ribosomal protein S18-alanine N-acetyltransferase [Clostridia bacterium]|nr:ribosomal protein S18-alanine N-acetyltransferase [Clostridia bacterium]